MSRAFTLSPDLSVTLDHAAITQAIFRGRETVPDWSERVLSIVSSIKPSLQPAAVYRWLKVEKVYEDKVTLVDPDTLEESVLTVGEHADELTLASMALCNVETLGEQFDGSVDRCRQTEDMLTGYLADCIGIYGLLQVSRAIYREVESVAARNGWGVGRVLSPGAIEGWALQEQERFCALLPIEKIGVALNDCGVLSPSKSVSFIIGIGPGYSASKVVSPCEICTNTGECWCMC